MTFLVPSNAKPGDLCYAPLPRDEATGARSREWTAAAQTARLQQLQVREAKTDHAAASRGALLEDAQSPGSTASSVANPGCGEINIVREEVCAICQEACSPGNRLLACKQCDNGFHARCLNEWLLRADSCPCCRATVGA